MIITKLAIFSNVNGALIYYVLFMGLCDSVSSSSTTSLLQKLENTDENDPALWQPACDASETSVESMEFLARSGFSAQAAKETVSSSSSVQQAVGGCSCLLAWFLKYPIDCVKRPPLFEHIL